MAQKCTKPNCKNSTKDVSGRCHHHRELTLVGAGSRGPNLPTPSAYVEDSPTMSQLEAEAPLLFQPCSECRRIAGSHAGWCTQK